MHCVAQRYSLLSGPCWFTRLVLSLTVGKIYLAPWPLPSCSSPASRLIFFSGASFPSQENHSQFQLSRRFPAVQTVMTPDWRCRTGSSTAAGEGRANRAAGCSDFLSFVDHCRSSLRWPISFHSVGAAEALSLDESSRYPTSSRKGGGHCVQLLFGPRFGSTILGPALRVPVIPRFCTGLVWPALLDGQCSQQAQPPAFLPRPRPVAEASVRDLEFNLAFRAATIVGSREFDWQLRLFVFSFQSLIHGSFPLLTVALPRRQGFYPLPLTPALASSRHLCSALFADRSADPHLLRHG